MDNKKHLNNTITSSSPGQSIANNANPIQLVGSITEASIATSEALYRLSLGASLWHLGSSNKPNGTGRSLHLRRRYPTHQPRIGKPKETGLKEASRRTMRRVADLSHRLIGQEPLNAFAENCEKVLGNWIHLLSTTTLPKNIASSDPQVITAFKAIDSVICGTQDLHLIRRLAYVQLMRLFGCIEGVIRSERRRGASFGAAGCQDASVAMNIYIDAQEPRLDLGRLRRELKERKRTARRWTELSGPSHLFVLMYSDATEPIVKDFRRFDGIILKLVAGRTLENCPAQLVRTCQRLTEQVETAAEFGHEFDLKQISASRVRQLLDTGREASLHTSNEQITSTIDLSDDAFLYREKMAEDSPEASPRLSTVPDDCHQSHGRLRLPPLHPRKAAKSAMENKGYLKVNTGRVSSLSQSLHTERQSPQISQLLG